LERYEKKHLIFIRRILEFVEEAIHVISQPTLEQVFLEFTAEKERQHGVATNEGERALAEAWDDTDVRLAELSKSRCCGCERKQHTRLAMVRACMTFF
jgi:uncharacterized membrane protein YqiK